jgi:hypothetical protein
MADEPENHTIRLLQEMRAEMREGFERATAETTRLHADVLDVRATCKEAMVRLTRIEKRLDLVDA